MIVGDLVPERDDRRSTLTAKVTAERTASLGRT